MSQRIWNIYLSGEIHTDWREKYCFSTGEGSAARAA